jgi:ectoine hydroxylase
MFLTPEQLNHYNEKGYLFLESVISEKVLSQINDQIPVVFAEDSPRKVYEKDNRTIRAIHAPHFTNKTFDHLKNYSKLLNPAMQILENKVYVHQYKLNVKAALAGEMWNWHQDYIFWEKEDGIPTSKLVNVSIFLDEVTEFNGPLTLIPGSHKYDNVKTVVNDQSDTAEEWMNHLSVDLKYTLDRQLLSKLAENYGIVAPKGPAGSILFFHPEVAHASAPNISPFDRKLLILTYNRVDNLPQKELTRPDFLAGRNHDPLEAYESFELESEIVKKKV